MHGARAGAPKGEANGAWRHGNATQNAIVRRRQIGQLLRWARRELTTIHVK